MTMDLSNLQHQLYELCRYDVDTINYLKYNQLLWANIQGLDQEAVEDAIKQLVECNK